MNSLRILDVPKKFMPPTSTVNPPHQGKQPLIEERFFQYVTNNSVSSDYIYIPIFWTQFHINNNYGKNLFDIKNYISEINSKYKNDKFFTIVQYDGGTLVPIDRCRIFACCGDFDSPIGSFSTYEPIPLLSENHKNLIPFQKKNLASFVGNLNTHQIRKELFLQYKDDTDFVFKTNVSFFKSFVFKKTTHQSYFALCPRGFGPSSFRLYEVLGMGQIPVYISDEFWLPYSNKLNWNEISILIPPHEIINLKKILQDCLENDYKKKKIKINEIKEDFFSWKGCINFIINKISNENKLSKNL